MSEYDATEASRQMANLFRIGRVTALDVKAKRAKVAVAGLETDWIPWMAQRAGRTRSWSPPRVGEQVVLGSPFGDLGQAIILGSLFQDDMPPSAESADQEAVLFPDGSTVDYNSATHTLTVNVVQGGSVVVNCQSATVKAAGSIMLDTPDVHVTGNVTVDGDVTAGPISLRNHVHTEQGDGAPVSKPQ